MTAFLRNSFFVFCLSLAFVLPLTAQDEPARPPQDDNEVPQATGRGYEEPFAFLRDTVAFLQQQTAEYQEQKQAQPRRLALTDFCQALFSLNEFIYIE